MHDEWIGVLFTIACLCLGLVIGLMFSISLFFLSLIFPILESFVLLPTILGGLIGLFVSWKSR